MKHINFRSVLLHLCIPAGFILLMMVGPVFPELFMYGNSAMFMMLMCSLVLFKRERTFLAGVMVVPLAVIVSLSLSKLSLPLRSILFYGTFLSVGLSFTKEYLYIKIHLFTLPPVSKMFFFGVIGALLGVVIANISLVTRTSLIDPMLAGMDVVQILMLLPVVTIGEEILYRRVIQNESEKIVPPFLSIIVTSILYAVVFFPLGPLPVFISYMISLTMGVLYLFSRRIVLTSITSLCMKVGFLAGLLIFHGGLVVR